MVLSLLPAPGTCRCVYHVLSARTALLERRAWLCAFSEVRTLTSLFVVQCSEVYMIPLIVRCLFFLSCSADYGVKTFAGTPYGSQGWENPSVDGVGSDARVDASTGFVRDPSSGLLYFSDYYRSTILTFNPNTTEVATVLQYEFYKSPTSRVRFGELVFDARNTLYASGNVNFQGAALLQVDLTTLTVSTVAGSVQQMGYVDSIVGTEARFGGMWFAIDEEYRVAYVGDAGNHVIRTIVLLGFAENPVGRVGTFAGKAGSAGNQDGSLEAARFNNPTNVIIDPPTRSLFVAVLDGIRRINLDQGIVTTISGTVGVQLYPSRGLFYGFIASRVHEINLATGAERVVAGNGEVVYKDSDVGLEASFHNSYDLYVDPPTNTAYVSDWSGTIRGVSAQ